MSHKIVYINGVQVEIGTHPIKKFLMVSGLVAWMGVSVIGYMNITEKIKINNDTINTLVIHENGNDEYLSILAQRESGNKWDIVGGYKNKYIGLYQFGDSALKDVGSSVTVKAFKKDKSIFPVDKQDLACIQLMRNNKHYLRNYYKFIGKKIKGVEINEAGMLASSHLCGHKAVKDFIDSKGKIVAKDGFGTPITEYFKLMKGVTVEL